MVIRVDDVACVSCIFLDSCEGARWSDQRGRVGYPQTQLGSDETTHADGLNGAEMECGQISTRMSEISYLLAEPWLSYSFLVVIASTKNVC